MRRRKYWRFLTARQVARPSLATARMSLRPLAFYLFSSSPGARLWLRFRIPSRCSDLSCSSCTPMIITPIAPMIAPRRRPTTSVIALPILLDDFGDHLLDDLDRFPERIRYARGSLLNPYQAYQAGTGLPLSPLLRACQQIRDHRNAPRRGGLRRPPAFGTGARWRVRGRA